MDSRRDWIEVVRTASMRGRLAAQDAGR